MTEAQLRNKLNELRSLPAETEVVEFKTAANNYDFKKIGKYFSALCNEANLNGKSEAWLIFGIENEHRNIVGSNYRAGNGAALSSLKSEIADKTTNRITFIEIYELNFPEGRVLMFKIPPAPNGFPIAWEGHYYGRDNEELVPLNMEEFERIRKQATLSDWSAVICEGATLDDLEPAAIAEARTNYKNKFSELAAAVDTWDDITFLNKTKIIIKGKITRTAIILLGRSESEHFINPAEAKIRWVLKDRDGAEKDYAIFTSPFIFAIDDVFNKIRNLKYRYLKSGTLFPEEVEQYEPFVIREALNNCIAHQDYTKGGRINVVEKDDELIFTNLGNFIPETIENVIRGDAPEESYRNPFLATAMFNLKMVDTIGSGIRRMFTYQRNRFFPMPEYDFSRGKVKVTITGKVLDIDYVRVLAQNPELSLEEIMMLDKVQKKKGLTENEIKHLREKKLVEGRKGLVHISASLAAATGQTVDYMKTKGVDDAFIRKTITDYLKKFHEAKREVFEKILINKLSDGLTEKQKQTKLQHTLQALKKEGIITLNTERKWTLISAE